jgi:hypothetical protein
LAQSVESLKIKDAKKCNEIITEFANFLSLANVASEPLSLRKNADFIMSMMNQRHQNASY